MKSQNEYQKEHDASFWRDVPGYGGKYQASRMGDVRRLYDSGKTRTLSPYTKKRVGPGKPFVRLTLDGKPREFTVLAVMVLTWHGGPPPGKVAYHVNGDLMDNCLNNIAFATRRELGRATGHMSSRRTVVKVDERGEVIDVYRSAREAARHNHMSYQTVLDRCNRKVRNEYALDGHTYRFEDEDGRGRNKEHVKSAYSRR